MTAQETQILNWYVGIVNTLLARGVSAHSAGEQAERLLRQGQNFAKEKQT